MLKLDPEDSDADMDDDRPDKSNTTSPVKGSSHQPQPIVPQIDFESSIDNLGGMQPMLVNNALPQTIPANLSNVWVYVGSQNSYNNNSSSATTTPAKGRGSRGTPKKQSTAKKGSSSAKPKKKRRISSSEEESDFNSDSDY